MLSCPGMARPLLTRVFSPCQREITSRRIREVAVSQLLRYDWMCKLQAARLYATQNHKARITPANLERPSTSLQSSPLPTAVDGAKLGINKQQKKYPIVYTDGACAGNGTAHAKAGYGVWWGEKDPRNVASPLHGQQTCNRAEFAAVNAALHTAIASGYPGVEVRTDSKYIYDIYYRWLPKWKKRKWLKADGKPVLNQDLVKSFDALTQRIDVVIKHVKSHSTAHGNSCADELAAAGAEISLTEAREGKKEKSLKGRKSKKREEDEASQKKEGKKGKEGNTSGKKEGKKAARSNSI